MQKHRKLTLQRVENYKDVFKSYLYISSEPLQLQSYAAPDRISYVDAMNGDYHPIALHTKFAPLWSTHWVRVNYTIPPEWAGQEVHLRWDSSSEATIWQDHQPIRGLSGEGPHWNSPYHATYILTPSAIAGESGHFHIEVAVNTPFGQLDKSPTSDLGFLRLAEIALFNREMWDLYWDFVVVADMAHHLPADGVRAGSALAIANEMINLFQPEDVNSIQSARDLAATFLSQQNGAGIHQVYTMGHAHIDTAWLWPLAETRRKCVRSFSTAVHLMERYPNYKFVCSQAQQLAWIKDDQPELYRKIKEKSVEGQFVFVGGSWVEPDCNLPSGEALVRQFLYGQRFFESEFGSTHDNFWLPDTFGYSPALPQIMRGVGISYFLTQKLSWNQFNKLPANTFYWEGLDGSRVLTHFPPADTYNGLGNVREIVEGTSRFRDHDRSDASIYLFGFGDGGGGPSAKMLEQLARMEDVNGLPIVQQNTPSAFFDHVEATADDLAIWVGELYFEAHRGTYTTQGYTKWANRRGQQQLHNAEFLTVLAQLDLRQELTLLWQRLLLNQFHDILPGSSIKEVYDDASGDYKLILSQSQSHIDHALETILSDNMMNNTYTVVNTLSHPRRAVIELPFEWATSQKSADDKPLVLVETPSLGYQQQTSTDNDHPTVSVSENDKGFVLENDWLQVRLSKDGSVTSLFDKELGREALTDAGNQFVLYEDRPIDWDAWDIDAFALERPSRIGGGHRYKLIESGSLRVALQFEYTFGASTLTQTISLTAVDKMLVFDTQVDWHEDHQLLKVEFPLAVHAPNALYETQFGYVERPTHRNTSWDVARFEVCAQRWAALREYGFGVALLNDSKHGYSTLGNCMTLSLLRAPAYPDATADRGAHQFRYALMPFDGKLPQVIRAGADFNTPLIAHPHVNSTQAFSMFNMNCEHVVIDTVKWAEDSDEVIVRIYEACGGRSTVTLKTDLTIRAASHCNLLEEVETPIVIVDNTFHFDIHPFQLLTFKLAIEDKRL